jgi:hypothetical protein
VVAIPEIGCTFLPERVTIVIAEDKTEANFSFWVEVVEEQGGECPWRPRPQHAELAEIAFSTCPNSLGNNLRPSISVRSPTRYSQRRFEFPLAHVSRFSKQTLRGSSM